jgi:hypothetical protein
MFGSFQTSYLRIEIPASAETLSASLLQPEQLQQWLAPVRLDRGLPTQLQMGLSFKTWVGVVPIQHVVDRVEPHTVRFLLSQGIDGFHEWHWGDGWVQSRLEGVSLLPINLAQSFSLLRLRQYAASVPRP